MPWSLMYCIASVGLQWKRGGSPSTISMTMIPSDQMSTWRGGEGGGEGGGREGGREGGKEGGGREGGREMVFNAILIAFHTFTDTQS